MHPTSFSVALGNSRLDLRLLLGTAGSDAGKHRLREAYQYQAELPQWSAGDLLAAQKFDDARTPSTAFHLA